LCYLPTVVIEIIQPPLKMKFIGKINVRESTYLEKYVKCVKM